MYAQAAIKSNTLLRNGAYGIVMRGVQKCTRGCSSLRGRKRLPLCCIKLDTATDPACGSGSLLLKAAKILGKENVRQGFYGQEINLTTYNLCRINMFLHDIDYDKFDIAHEDTLMNPQHWDDEPFEVIVSNPPYSIKWEGDDNPVLINDPRFSPAGVLAPKSKADLAFIIEYDGIGFIPLEELAKKETA